ncbi:MAG: lytic transglycosylase domain-containing protein [Betaproteobacteria bacterium]|nr:lytic transglycosylase domain-containing protein [Betaproteobacteria bacterium]
MLSQHFPLPKRLIAAIAAAGLLLPQSAGADIYSFKDEQGITHFTNMPHLDKRYKLIYRIPTSGDLRPNAWSPRGPKSVDFSKLAPIIAEAARQHGVDLKLVHAVIRAESGYNTQAISAKGAVGLMQLIPATAQRYGVQNMADPAQNISGGVRYLRDLLKIFNGDIELALAGYNAGENAVLRAGNRIPPYPETMAYVPKVLNFYRTIDLSRL